MLIWKSQSVHKWGLRRSLKFQPTFQKWYPVFALSRIPVSLTTTSLKLQRYFMPILLRCWRIVWSPYFDAFQKSTKEGMYILFCWWRSCPLYRIQCNDSIWTHLSLPGCVFKCTWPMIARSERVKPKLIILFITPDLVLCLRFESGISSHHRIVSLIWFLVKDFYKYITHSWLLFRYFRLFYCPIGT